MVDWTALLKRNSSKDVFSENFQNNSFSEHPTKITLYDFRRNILKWLHYKPLPAIFQLYQNSPHFLRGSVFIEVRNSGQQACIAREKGQFCKALFEIFEILEHYFPSEYFQKSICRGVFSLVRNCRL